MYKWTHVVQTVVFEGSVVFLGTSPVPDMVGGQANPCITGHCPRKCPHAATLRTPPPCLPQACRVKPQLEFSSEAFYWRLLTHRPRLTLC